VNQQRASLEAAEAASHAAEADLGHAKVDAEGPDVPILKRAYERAQVMAKEGVLSTSALEDAQKNYELALNKQQLGESKTKSPHAPNFAQTQAQVSQVKAQLDQAEQQLRYATIVSPLDGVVLSRDVEVGDGREFHSGPGSSATLVMTLGETREVYVLGKVDESDISKVYLNQPARIKSGILQRPYLRGTRHQDFSHGRGEGQRNHFRSSGFHR